MSRTAVFLAMRAFALFRSRLPLMRRLTECGFRVAAVCEDDSKGDELRAEGVELCSVPFHSRGRSLANLPGLYAALRVAVARLDPEFVHAYNAVPIVLGGFLGRGARPPLWVNTVTGLGRGVTGSGIRSRLVMAGYRLAARRADHTVFQNNHDRSLVVPTGASWRAKTSVILGSGVDTSLFTPADRPRVDERVRFLMVGRMLWSKGVREYCEAARMVRASHPEAEFLLAGEFVEEDPDAVPPTWIRSRVEAGDIEFLGYRDDLPVLLRSVDVLVHPTRYAEGLPRVLLEAAACGLAVVAIDGPGSGEAVIAGRTGVLLNRSSGVADLVAELLLLVADPLERRNLGRAAREHVIAHHDLRSITARYLALYESLGVRF